MNLIALFDSLTLPRQTNQRVLAATPIPGYPQFRIAVNSEGNPVLLVSLETSPKNTTLKNFRLKYLQFEQNIGCRIIENNKSTVDRLTLITLKNTDRDLQEYFLQISETLLKTLSKNSNQQEIIQTLCKFIEIFLSLSEAPRNTVQGLWSELFLINNSIDPRTLLAYWHSYPEEKFDFNAGLEKVEVKSSSTFERRHTFSSAQLNPPQGTQVLIASLFVKQVESGQNIQELIKRITLRIQPNIELTEKLNRVVCQTLGNSLEESIKIGFDYQIAKDSLRFYRHQDIDRVEEVYIPAAVSDVKFTSDLSRINSINMTVFKPKGVLFSKVQSADSSMKADL